MSQGPITSFVGVVHPWMCDVMAHLNVRHYVAMFDDASFQLLAHVGGIAFDAKRWGWADVRMEIDYLKETTVGTAVSIHSHVERIGTSSLTYSHALSGTLDGVVRARMRVVTVHFDLLARSKAELSAPMRERASGLKMHESD